MKQGNCLKYPSFIRIHQNRKKKNRNGQFWSLLKKYPISIIAIGNGTASRETELFIVECIKEAQAGVSYVIVNEAGASVYSASAQARDEFPDLQVEAAECGFNCKAITRSVI